MKKWSLYILVIALAMGCAKDEIEGPELQDLFGEFEILEELTLNTTSVDFAAGETVQFSAELSIRTDWQITIIGLESGAKKVIEGREREISGGVAEWNGTITFAPIFGQEECTTMMTFTHFEDTLWGDNITVESARLQEDVQLVVSDFEDPTQVFGSFAEQAAFNQRVSGSYFQDLYTTPASFEQVNPAEQDGFWAMTANNGSAIFICGMNLTGAQATGNNGATYFDFGNQNPDHVYLNAFVRGFGNQSTRLAIGFQEDDNLDGTYSPQSEGTWQTEILVDWHGWKVVSIPLSQTTLSTTGGFGNIDGTGQKDLDRVINIEFLLLAVEGTTGMTGYGLDFINTTLFYPYQP